VRGHDLDIGTFFGDMAVLGRVIFSDDEVGAIGREIVLVLATKFLGFSSNFGLEEGRGASQLGAHV